MELLKPKMDANYHNADTIQERTDVTTDTNQEKMVAKLDACL